MTEATLVAAAIAERGTQTLTAPKNQQSSWLRGIRVDLKWLRKYRNEH